MATHSSILAWRIPWTEEPGGYSPSVQFSSVAQSCPTLCDPVNHSMPGLPVLHQLLEFTQTHVHRVAKNQDITETHTHSDKSCTHQAQVQLYPILE